MKARIRFSKSGCMKYIGHLDIMRYFQKVIRRSGLPIKYSEGFNPHQIMSFAAPLGVGLTSSGEYMDIELKEYVPSEIALKAIKDNMAEDTDILSFKYLPDNSTNAMASVAAARYYLTYKHPENFDFSIDELIAHKKLFFDQAKSIDIIKKTKKSERELDIKPLIYDFQILNGDVSDCFTGELGQDENGNDITNPEIVFYLDVCACSSDNLKPEMVLRYFFASFGVEADDRNAFFIHRIDMLTKDANDNFISLDEVGSETLEK